EHALGGLKNRKTDVGADIEDADLEWRLLVGVVEEGGDLLLLSRIERTGVDFTALGLDLLHQRLQLGAVASSGENREAFRGKSLRDLAADEIAGPDDRHGRVSLLHGRLHQLCDTLLEFAMTFSCDAPQRLRQFVLEDLSGRGRRQRVEND